MQMVQFSLQGDYEEAEVAPAAKLLQVVLQVGVNFNTYLIN